MRITDLDPIPYNLLFERFLNPERVSMPDFDVDFCMDRRDEVIAYVAAEVRQDERRADRDVPRAQGAERHQGRRRARMGFPPIEAQKIASLIPQKRPGRDVHDPRGARDRAEAQGAAARASRTVARAAHAGAEARGADAPRRHARRRRRDQRGAALGSRARASRTASRARHAVLQGRRRAGGPRQVRLPRPEDAHRHRHRRSASSTRGPDLRAAASSRSTSTTIPLDDKPTLPAPASRARRRACSSSSRAGMQQLFKDLAARRASRTSSPPSRSTARARSAPAW